MPASPLILGNALYWCAENSRALADRKLHHTGDLLAADGLIKWHAWDGTHFTDTADNASHGLLPLHRIGIWESADGQTGASILASSEETNLPVHSAETSPTPLSGRSSIITASAFSTWPKRLIWLVLSLLLLESFLFHRKAVY